MCRIHTKFKVRQGAGVSKAMDACNLLTSALPFVHQIMTAAQIDQIQAAVDAAGSPASRLVLVSKWGLSSTKLLTSEALRPMTNNPDEAAYLNEMRQILLQKGVWLRIDERPLKFGMAPYFFLSLGPDGDEIPTKDGRLTRENLLGNGVLGDGYERKVNEGRHNKEALQKAIKRLRKNIEAGELQCKLLAQQVLEEDPRITGAKNLLGGRGFKGFPFSTIWAKPRKLMEKAEVWCSAGEISVSQGLLVQAAVMTSVAAKEINAFIDAGSVGAERAVAVLEWVEIAGAWAGLFAGVSGGPARGNSAAGKSAAAAQTRQAVRADPRAVYPANATHYRGSAAYSKTVNQANITKASTGGGGGGLNRYDLSTQKRIQEQLKGAADEVSDFLRNNPHAPFAEKLKMIERAHAKWGIDAILDSK